MNYIYPELYIPFKETQSSLHGLAVDLTIDSPFIPALFSFEKKKGGRGGCWNLNNSTIISGFVFITFLIH